MYSRSGNLGCLLAEFQLIEPLALIVPNHPKLINTSKRRLIVCGHKFCSYTPNPDSRTLFLEAGDNVLVQIITRDNHCFLKSSGVEHFSRLDAQPGKITRIKTDAGQLMSSFTQP